MLVSKKEDCVNTLGEMESKKHYLKSTFWSIKLVSSLGIRSDIGTRNAVEVNVDQEVFSKLLVDNKSVVNKHVIKRCSFGGRLMVSFMMETLN